MKKLGPKTPFKNISRTMHAGRNLAAWVKKFPDEFYENIYKLKGWV